jgi:ribosomal protein S18 acetylase RimI-like enzyme
MEKVNIRPFDFSKKDCKKILSVDNETFNECNYSYDEIIEIAKDINNHIFIAEIGEKEVGFISFMAVKTLHYRGLWIDLIGVKKEFSGLGIGKLLIKTGDKLAMELGVDFESALIREDNISSLKAFEKSGFNWDGKTFKLYFKNRL